MILLEVDPNWVKPGWMLLLVDSALGRRNGVFVLEHAETVPKDSYARGRRARQRRGVPIGAAAQCIKLRPTDQLQLLAALVMSCSPERGSQPRIESEDDWR